MKSDSIVFDQAVEYYDRTRALPPELQARVTAFLVSRLREREPVLEVGVGTGRIGLPVVGAGVRVVGIDLSEPMLGRLVRNAGDPSVLPVARGDALALPFADGVVGGAYVCHVLHLVPDWRSAVAELVRVVRAGGLVLADIGGSQTSRGREVGERFQELTGAGPLRPGVREAGELDAAFARLGCAAEQPVTFPHELEYTVGAILHRLESNQWSSTWTLSDDVRLRAVAETRRWAEERYGDLGQPVREDVAIIWRGYETPA